MKQINIDQFCKDVSELPTLNNIQGTVNELVDRYNLGLRTLLDKHVPIILRVVTVRRHAPWYTESLLDTKRCRRRLERLWRHSKEVNIDNNVEVYPCNLQKQREIIILTK